VLATVWLLISFAEQGALVTFRTRESMAPSSRDRASGAPVCREVQRHVMRLFGHLEWTSERMRNHVDATHCEFALYITNQERPRSIVSSEYCFHA
jgi:hypothetical protein